MNEAEVRAILARTEAATPGPWHIAAEHEEHSWWGHADAGTIILGPDPDGFAVGATNDDGIATETDVANAAFVVAARADVPALAREVLALREALAALCDWHTWPEVAGAFGFVAAHGITVTPQIAEKAGAIWSQARALLADEEKP